MANRTDSLNGWIWANGAGDPPALPIVGTTYVTASLTQSVVEGGWPYSEVVNSANFNAIMQKITALLASAESYGVMAWSALTSYPAGAVATGSDGVIYEAVAPNIGYDPSIDPGTRWRRYVPEEVQLLIGKTFTSTDDKIDNFPAGTVMPFYQAAPPTGWILKTTNNDAMLRVVSTAGGGSGGTASPITMAHTHTDTFSSATTALTIGGTALTIAQMPAHTHTVPAIANLSSNGGGNNIAQAPTSNTTITSNSTGSGGTHTHSLASHTHTLNGSVSSANINPKYIDVINCTKN